MGSRKITEIFLRFRLATVLGSGLFVAGLYQYRSYMNRPILGIWSYSYFAVIVVASALFLVLLARSFLRNLRKNPAADPVGSPTVVLFDFALLSWGIAYFLSAWDEPEKGGRVVDLNFFGSDMPAAALLEWLALLLLFLALAAFVIARLKGKWVNGQLAIGTVLVVLVLGEGITRVKVTLAPATEGFPTYSSAVWVRQYVKRNRDGWRDIDHAISPDPGTRRLMVVGDSIAFGSGVRHIHDRLGEQLANMLTRQTNQHWESINVSRGDSHTLDEIGFMQRAAAYKPDVVLLIYVFNDIDYLAPVTPREGPFTAGRAFVYRFHPLWLLYKNSYLFQEVFVRLRLIYYRIRGDGGSDPYRDRSLVSRHLADVARFVAIARQASKNVLVVPFDHRVVLDPNQRKRYHDFANQALAYGILICSLENAFDGFAYHDLTINALDGHPNVTAHHLAANALMPCLVKDIGKQSQLGRTNIAAGTPPGGRS